MQVAVILTMLCALVHATTVEHVPVEIKLGKEKDTPRLKRTFDTADFGCMEVFNVLDEQQSEQDIELLKAQLGMISDEDMIAQLKKCWNSDMTDSDKDIDADTFYNFIEAADYLLLQGDKYKQFVKNVVRKGVLGEHSMAIVRQHLGTGHMGYTSLFWSMLIALASECSCEVRVVKHDDHETEVTLCYVRDCKAKSYGVPGSVLETRPVIDKLSIRCNILSNTVDRMEILTWLTDHLEVTLLWIGSEFGMTEEDTQSLVKWDEKKTSTRLGLSLDFSGYKQSSYSFVEAIIRWCLSLITSRYKQPGYSFVKNLIPTIPALEELHIRRAVFEPSAAHVFGQCVGLEKLCLDGYGCCQTSPFVSSLMPSIPNIRELTIDVKELNQDVAAEFRQCKGLEKLCLDGYGQTSSFVSALMPNLSNIRELMMNTEELSTDTAKAFRECKRLEKLDLGGSMQTSSFVSALMSNLPLANIKELMICVDELETEDAMAFKQCKGLEKLHLIGSIEPGCVECILSSPHMQSLRHLQVSRVMGDLSDGDERAIDEARKRHVEVNVR